LELPSTQASYLVPPPMFWVATALLAITAARWKAPDSRRCRTCSRFDFSIVREISEAPLPRDVPDCPGPAVAKANRTGTCSLSFIAMVVGVERSGLHSVRRPLLYMHRPLPKSRSLGQVLERWRRPGRRVANELLSEGRDIIAPNHRIW
jgi:hypothetical protein